MLYHVAFCVGWALVNLDREGRGPEMCDSDSGFRCARSAS